MSENIATPKTGIVNPTPAPTTDTVQAAPEVEADSKVEQLQKLSDAENEPKGPNQSEIDTLIPSDPYYTDPLFYQVANYLGVAQSEWDSAKDALSDIVDFTIREIKDNRPSEVLNFIRSIERSLEKPGWDEKRYKHIHAYIKLGLSKQAISRSMEAFKKQRVEEGGAFS